MHYRDYVKPESLEEAYELNKKKSAVIAGGFCFLRMGSRTIGTLIDLSSLLSSDIEETKDSFRIGAMTTLRVLETHEALNSYTCGAVRDSVKHIVGTQFRNCATIGGSIFGRFGFSDVLTCFMVMDAYVELYKGGIIPLCEFAQTAKDDDILIAIIVKKTDMKMAWESMRNASTDFPVLAVAAAEYGDNKTVIAVGARPQKAGQTVCEGALSCLLEGRAEEADRLAGRFTYGTNLRGSSEYRRYLGGVLINRAAERIYELKTKDKTQDKTQEVTA